MTTRQYSHLFSCLYDQPAPIGRLGRGAHHSVFRSVQWREVGGQPYGRGRVHDFAVIWDEDHDERVIRVAEQLHLADLLWPVVFIGERKGTVTLLLDHAGGPDLFQDESRWIDGIRDVARKIDGDTWTVAIGMYHRAQEDREETQTDPAGIIAEGACRVVPYLQAIDVLWLLGDRDSAFWIDADG